MTRDAVRFADTETHLVPLALGAMLMGTATPAEESFRILDHFVQEVAPRYRAPDGGPALAMIDTADCYCWWLAPGEGGHSELLVGRWLRERGARDLVHLATKGTARLTSTTGDDLWPNGPEGGADWPVARTRFVGGSPEVLRRSLEGSLERLGVDRVDLYYEHVDDRRVPLTDAVGTFASFLADGRIGGYGWSNVTSWRLGQVIATADAIGAPRPTAVQQQHTYLRPRQGPVSPSLVTEDHLDLLRAHPDLQAVAYTPTLKGAFSVPARRDPGFWAMADYHGPDADARFAAVDRVAAATGATGTQVVLAWMRGATDPRVLPLIGPRTFDQYLESVESLDLELTAEQRAELDQAGVG